MFFSLAHDQDPRFPCHHRITDQMWLSTDEGWHRDGDRVIKGYADSRPLAEVPRSQELRGNYCAFVADGERVHVQHDQDRGFPMWRSRHRVTNLAPELYPVWADRRITVHPGLEVAEHAERRWQLATVASDQDIIDQIHRILIERFREFFQHNQLPVRFFHTGGLDTTLLWALLDHTGVQYEMLDYEYIKFTPFYRTNKRAIQKYWAYTQMHLWSEPCVLVTGGCGDEFLLRGPTTLAMALARHSLTIQDVTREGDYHHHYYQKKPSQEHTPGVDMRGQIMNMLHNDHQHWHLDNTLHFTPYKDARLPALMLEASAELLTAQARNGEVNRELIRRMDASKLKHITARKNSS